MPYSQGHSLDSVMEMVATAAGTAVLNVVGMIGTVASPSVQNAAMEVQWYGPLPSLHPSPCQTFLLIAPTSSTRQTCRPSPKRAYTSLATQCLILLCDGLAGYAIPLYNTLAVQKPPAGSPKPVRAPGPFDPSTLPESGPARDARCWLSRATCRSILPSHHQAFRPPIWRCRWRCRRSPAQRGALHCARRATRSSSRSLKPPSHHGSSLCSMNLHKRSATLYRFTGGAHAGPRGQRCGQWEWKRRRTEPTQFCVLARTCRCCDVSSRHAGLLFPGA